MEKKTNHQEVFYLNAWEFLTLWEIKVLPADKQAIERLTQRSFRASPKLCFFLFGPSLDRVQEVSAFFFCGFHLHVYKYNTAGFTDCRRRQGDHKLSTCRERIVDCTKKHLFWRERPGDVLRYPAGTKSCEELYKTFYMQRRFRPMVPAPASCPMPDKQRYAEKRDRLFLLYLQPWVLEKAWALPGVVPHLSDLNEVRDDTEVDVIRGHSYSEAWKNTSPRTSFPGTRTVSSSNSWRCAVANPKQRNHRSQK